MSSSLAQISTTSTFVLFRQRHLRRQDCTLISYPVSLSFALSKSFLKILLDNQIQHKFLLLLGYYHCSTKARPKQRNHLIGQWGFSFHKQDLLFIYTLYRRFSTLTQLNSTSTLPPSTSSLSTSSSALQETPAIYTCGQIIIRGSHYGRMDAPRPSSISSSSFLNLTKE